MAALKLTASIRKFVEEATDQLSASDKCTIEEETKLKYIKIETLEQIVSNYDKGSTIDWKELTKGSKLVFPSYERDIDMVNNTNYVCSQVCKLVHSIFSSHRPSY